MYNTFCISLLGIQSLPPQSLQLVNATCSTLTIEWVEPHTGNVHFIGYAIRIRSVNDRIGKWKYIESNTTNNTFIVHGLNASVLYEIQVGAVYNEVDGVSGVGMSGSGVEDMNIVYSDSLLATTPPTGMLTAPHADTQTNLPTYIYVHTERDQLQYSSYIVKV